MQKLARKIDRLLKQQRLAVLGTYGKNETYQSLVAFTVHNKLKNILFVTERNTRKYRNIKENSKVAVLVDNRLNKRSDFYKAVSITALGVARQTNGVERKRLLKVHEARHPDIKAFLQNRECVLFKINVRTYYFVSHFQQVQELVV
jgi:heme iron utilization protein